MVCKYCDDGEGKTRFPYYGVAPHTCFYKIGKKVGQSETLPESKFPKNFEIDGEWSEHSCCGVYTHCLECGDKSF